MKDIKCSNCLQIYVHICAICSNTFKSNDSLQDHIKAVHETHKDVHNFKRLNKCVICNKRFSGPGLLMYHVLSIHTDEEPSDDDKRFLEKVNKNQCPICNESFKQKFGFKNPCCRYT